VYDIVEQVNERGLSGLDEYHPGKKGPLTPELRNELTALLENRSRPADTGKVAGMHRF